MSGNLKKFNMIARDHGGFFYGPKGVFWMGNYLNVPCQVPEKWSGNVGWQILLAMMTACKSAITKPCILNSSAAGNAFWHAMRHGT